MKEKPHKQKDAGRKSTKAGISIFYQAVGVMMGKFKMLRG